MTGAREGPYPDPYAALGVRAFINCCGTRTIHGGTLMVPAARAAMHDAATRFVNLNELMEAAGARLAGLTGAPWAIVTCGGAAALCHAAAAAIAGADPEMMLRLPDTRGMRRRIVMTRVGRFTYDHALRMVGAEIVEAATHAELEAALDEGAVMVCLLGKKEAEGPLRLEAIAEAARARGIPVLVDAAAEHLRAPEPYLARGATMVAYSGGKFLRGPQASGLLLGERAWLDAAWRNSAPHHAFGRPLKVGKEEIIGLVAAVEHWAAERDAQAELGTWEADLATIGRLVTAVAGVQAEVVHAGDPTEPVPRLLVRWADAGIDLPGLALRERLMDGEPRIMLDDRASTESSIFIDPFSLQPGEAAIVGERVRQALAAAPPATARAPADVTEVDVTGAWEVRIDFYRGSAGHAFELEQSGTAVSGRHTLVHRRGAITGAVRGQTVTMSSRHPYEGTNLSYTFSGRVDGDAIAGTVRLGSTGNSAPGPVNEREYGEATWRAVRCPGGAPNLRGAAS